VFISCSMNLFDTVECYIFVLLEAFSYTSFLMVGLQQLLLFENYKMNKLP
jgi:hypothetical protein